ncbi:hypothetical protein N7527_007253 [Penicillium freii]|uniref:Fungal N-terminal domain-containing protein n=1 Tax=Penicillium freii TaxID=48697 RepID=A0A101MFX2_PENFR|nr:hypothetical protein N7527_007253 [Penicillium freii]KUM59844.1 hypothetical protein ACN42_g7290 [Penicillium freii]
MDGLSIAAAALGFATAVLHVFSLFDGYRQLAVTKELGYLLAKVDTLRATLAWTTTSVENTLKHASPSSEADFQHKAFCEDLQKRLVHFKKTAKIINHEVHRICGKTGSKLSKNYDGVLKLRRVRSSKKLLQGLQERLVFHESSIKLLTDSMNTYAQQALLQSIDTKVDRIVRGLSGLPKELGAQQADTPISTKKSKASTPQLVSGFYQGKNDYLDDLLQILQPFSVQESVQYRQMVWIYGKEGAGKTHLCSKFANEHKTSYWGVFWLNAGEDCIESLNPTSSGIYMADKLSDVEKPWLLIVDNAQDLTQARRHFPSGDKGHILVTTRSSPPASVDSVHVSEMDPEEEKGFLLWAAGLTLPWRGSELAWADEVIRQFSPKVNLLTLTHVGAPIRNGLCTREDYVSLLKEQQTLLEGQQTKQNKPEELALKVALKQIRKQKTRSSVDAFILLMASSVFATRYITLDTLAESMLPIKIAKKQQRLGHYACFHQSKAQAGSRRKFKNFTSKLIRRNGKVGSGPQVSPQQQNPGSLDRLRAGWAITELVDMSLFLYHPSNDTYSVQPAVQQWVADKLSSLETPKSPKSSESSESSESSGSSESSESPQPSPTQPANMLG